MQVLELICTRESGAVFEAGGLNCVLSFIRDSGHLVHKDTLHSAMAVVSRLCSKMEPQDPSLETCVESLSSLLKHEDHQVTTPSAAGTRRSYLVLLVWLVDWGHVRLLCDWFLSSRCLTERCAALPRWPTDLLAAASTPPL